MRNGGHLLAIDIDCVETNWKSEVTSAEQVQPQLALEQDSFGLHGRESWRV